MNREHGGQCVHVGTKALCIWTVREGHTCTKIFSKFTAVLVIGHCMVHVPCICCAIIPTEDLYIPEMSRIKAGLIPVVANVKARLLFTSGFYLNQVFLCMSTLKPGLCADSVS